MSGAKGDVMRGALRTIICGGQSGVEQAAWRAAALIGLRTDGRMPRGYATEDGPRPDFAESYGAVSIGTDRQSDHSDANVREADATIIMSFGIYDEPTMEVFREVGRLSKTCLLITAGDWWTPRRIAEWLSMHRVATLHVTGDKESNRPGIGAWAEPLLAKAFELAKR